MLAAPTLSSMVLLQKLTFVGNTLYSASVQGGAVNDSVTAGDGADEISLGAGADTVNAGAGNDRIGAEVVLDVKNYVRR